MFAYVPPGIAAPTGVLLYQDDETGKQVGFGVPDLQRAGWNVTDIGLSVALPNAPSLFLISQTSKLSTSHILDSRRSESTRRLHVLAPKKATPCASQISPSITRRSDGRCRKNRNIIAHRFRGEHP